MKYVKNKINVFKIDSRIELQINIIVKEGISLMYKKKNMLFFFDNYSTS